MTPPSARDADATRRRILAAAIDEFSSYGLAGARVDRIAAAATANKRLIYVYFGDKDGLFQAALHRVIGEVSQAVPFEVADLPGYAGRLFDHLLTHPEAWRMGMWLVLEGPENGPDEGAGYAEKLAAMTVDGRSETINGIAAGDVVVLIIGLVRGWFMSPAGLLAADGVPADSPQRVAIHRAAIVASVERICGQSAAAAD